VTKRKTPKVLDAIADVVLAYRPTVTLVNWRDRILSALRVLEGK
jgi:hypothetical protein